jgi:uncharacterized Zn-binding protein involved in type VI secretion
MPAAARIGDSTDHGGTLLPLGLAQGVYIEGLPAAVVGDKHKCGITPPPPHPTVSPIVKGSTTVSIGGFPAARADDKTACGAGILVGAPTVQIGD